MFQIAFEDLIYLHNQIVEESGGLQGLKDEGVIRSALTRPYQTAFGKETYPDIFDKAGALLESIANNHGFNDGNKRTAMAAAVIFLFAHGIEVIFTNKEYEEFMIYVVTSKPHVREISGWLKKHATF